MFSMRCLFTERAKSAVFSRENDLSAVTGGSTLLGDLALLNSVVAVHGLRSAASLLIKHAWRSRVARLPCHAYVHARMLQPRSRSTAWRRSRKRRSDPAADDDDDLIRY